MRPPTKGLRPASKRGSLASELKSLNSAHASFNGLASASPDSMPGMLNTYRNAALAEQESIKAVEEAAMAVKSAMMEDIMAGTGHA